MEIGGFLVSSKLFLLAAKCTTRPIYGLEYFPVSQHSSNLVQSFPLPIYQRMSCKMLGSKYLSSISFTSSLGELLRRCLHPSEVELAGPHYYTFLDLYVCHVYFCHIKVILSLSPLVYSMLYFVTCTLCLYIGGIKTITSPLDVRKLLSVDCLR